MNLAQLSDDYRRIEKAIEYLENNYLEQPRLEAVAAAANLSEYHFQRLFSRWAGISPKRFLQFLTKEHAKSLLKQSQSVLAAAYDSGLSSPGRLHDLLVECDGITPGEYKQLGEGLEIRYGIHPTPFGNCLLAISDRGITNVMFEQETSKDLTAVLRKQWPNARLNEDPHVTGKLIQQIFEAQEKQVTKPLHLFLKGTNFQIKVWEALLQIPQGEVASYEDIAMMLGNPKAVRAVAGAVAKNPVAYIIPCHRVIRKSGAFNQYRWGSARKKAMLLREEALAG